MLEHMLHYCKNYVYAGTFTIHSPELDLPIISSRDQQRKGRMEGHPVHTTIVTLAKDNK